LMMSLWDALRMNMMISYQELVRTFPSTQRTFFTLVELLRPHSVIIFAPEFVSLPLQRDRRSCWDKVKNPASFFIWLLLKVFMLTPFSQGHSWVTGPGKCFYYFTGVISIGCYATKERA
ncbi:hypothetical protein, partial [Klebsiella pneumoniae]|uniref:hypothetical protein n=4 Tax=Klebsiella/Raoultella group TaxID=2890311 RepID=UPI0007D6E60F